MVTVFYTLHLAAFLVLILVMAFLWYFRELFFSAKHLLAKIVSLMLFIMACQIGILCVQFGTKAYRRATTVSHQETLTIDTISRDERRLPMLCTEGLKIVTVEYLELTTKEYPDHTVTLEGHYDFKPGSNVNVTVHELNGGRIRFEL